MNKQTTHKLHNNLITESYTGLSKQTHIHTYTHEHTHTYTFFLLGGIECMHFSTLND